MSSVSLLLFRIPMNSFHSKFLLMSQPITGDDFMTSPDKLLLLIWFLVSKLQAIVWNDKFGYNKC